MKTRTVSVTATFMSNVISNAEKSGYYMSKSVQKLTCPDCGSRHVKVFHSCKDETKYEKIYACTCGWRMLFSKRIKTIKKICKTEGCNVILPKGRDTYCYKCQPYEIGEGNTNSVNKFDTKRICRTNGCNVILPKERKAYCYKCRPHKIKDNTNSDTKEVASKTNIIM